ncbi:MAG: peptidase M23 [Candidatus Thorarchaeota archaeon]|nr:MAG: peptidase M23 [Candidatus Thorarchaeota archaeon]
MRTLESILRKNRSTFGQVVPVDLAAERLCVFDFSAKNKELLAVNLAHTEDFDRYIKKTLKSAGATVGIGGYNEDRTIYRHSSLFVTPEGESRTVHLGIDIFLPVGTKVFAPIDGAVHSFQNNRGMGDNGPTVVLEHHLEGMGFYTLYSHLSEETLDGKSEGMIIEKGEVIGEVGNMRVNGNWPPHLHFQIIRDMLGKKGDYFGVASLSKREQYLHLCPDPSLILRMPTGRPGRRSR